MKIKNQKRKNDIQKLIFNESSLILQLFFIYLNKILLFISTAFFVFYFIKILSDYLTLLLNYIKYHDYNLY